jgi:RHS repeat-associated protein
LSRIYNTLGQIQTLKDANLAATGMTYDANGALNTSTDALGRVTDGDVDALGRLSQIIANLNNKATDQATTKFQYDTRNNLTAVIDPKGLTTGYTYDGLDNLRQLSSPDSGVTSYGYDAAGNRVSKLDARGITTTYNYDALSRLTGQLGPTVAQNAYFDYDLPTSDCLGGETFDVHRLAQIRDESGSTRYCYDRLGNLVRKVQGVSGGTTLTTGDTYNVAGRVSAITYPSGATVTYQRDSDGRITRINAVPVVGASQVTLVSSVSYLPFGPIAALTFGNGRVLTKAYDKNYGVDIVSDSVTGGLSEDLTLNSVGAVTGLAERVSASSSVGRTFVYDGLDRLTTQKNGNTTVEGFKYDTTGNRTSKTVGNTTTTYGYQSTNHRLSAVGSLARTYDASGSTALIGSGASAPGFVFDDGGRLRDYKVGTVVKASYRYNGNGERVLRIDSANGANSEQFVYDEAEHLLGEYTLTGARVKEYVWLEDTLVAVLSDHDGSNYQFVETDQLGTPRAVIHPVKNIIIWRWDLNNTAFGEHLPNADPDANALSYTLNVRYAGQYYDGISGLEYNYFRDYDAATGRYLESDPTGLLGGTSTYGYSMERPLDFFDETGLGSAPSRGLSAASRSAGSRAAYRAFMRNNTGPRPDFSELYSERSSQSLEAASEMNNWRPPDYICVDVWCHPQQKNPHECSIGEDVWSHKDFYKPYPTVGEVNAMGNCICKRGINAADYEYEAPSANGYDAAEVYAKQRELARAMKEAQMRELRD